jgi:hypothetical protein
MNRHGYSIYSCQTSFYDHYIGGDEEADYANSKDDAEAISDLRLTCLVKNSIKVIKESQSKIKYLYLLFHIYKLNKNISKGHKNLFIKILKTSLLN